MTLAFKIKESRLSPDGLFYLTAARCQSIENALALRQDDYGYVYLYLGSNGERSAILVADGATEISWTIPQDLIDSYRAREIGPVKLVNDAGRALRAHAVIGYRWTIREWIKDFGQQFGLSSPGYIRQMCRGDVVGIGGKRVPYKAKLPAPFRGVQDGGRWFITV